MGKEIDLVIKNYCIKCPNCEQKFYTNRTDRKWCSVNCRSIAWDKKNRQSRNEYQKKYHKNNKEKIYYKRRMRYHRNKEKESNQL